MATEKRLIEANALQSKICGAKCGCAYEDCGCEGDCQFDFFISNAPTVDAVEVVHGRWEDSYGGKYANPRYVCSECQKKAPYKFEDDELHIGLWRQELTDYCPDCGAKMDGDGNA